MIFPPSCLSGWCLQLSRHRGSVSSVFAFLCRKSCTMRVPIHHLQRLTIFTTVLTGGGVGTMYYLMQSECMCACTRWSNSLFKTETPGSALRSESGSGLGVEPANVLVCLSAAAPSCLCDSCTRTCACSLFCYLVRKLCWEWIPSTRCATAEGVSCCHGEPWSPALTSS